MKKLYTILTLLMCSIVSAQDVTFDNQAGAGDGAWETTTNWIEGALPTSTQWASFTASATLSSSQTIKQISLRGNSVTGLGTLTFDGGGQKTLLAAANPGDLHLFDVPVIINDVANAGTASTFQLNGATKVVTFNKSLTVTTETILRGASTTSTFNVNGPVTGSARLTLSGSVYNFPASSNNSGFTGNIYANTVSTNAPDIFTSSSTEGGFLNTGSTFQSNNTLSKLHLNAVNIMKGNIEVQNATNLLLDVNANQSSVGHVTIGGGILTIDVDAGVTVLSFANSSANVWGAGSIAITGFKEGVIHFGMDNTGLTAQQLSQITADGVGAGQTLALNLSGYLVLASSLSTDEFALSSAKRISYPTAVEGNIYFSKPINSVAVYSVTGNKVMEVASKVNALEALSVSKLRSGLYFMVLDGIKTEKFIKR